MNFHTLKVLEYDRIVEKLHDLCFSSPAKKIAISPSDNLSAIENSLDCLTEMIELYQVDGGPPSLTFGDVDFIVEKAMASGDILEPAELLKVVELYDVVRGWTKLDKRFEHRKTMTSKLNYDEELAATINRVIQPPKEIRDNASPELKRIRKELRQTRENLEAKFSSYIDSEFSSCLSDNVYTIRDGRYVLPVKESFKGRVKGIVHDRSSTGATFFVEPMEAVEQNNNLRELIAAEHQEILRILRDLTDKIFANNIYIKNNVKILAELDILSAKARFALKLNCVRPIINSDYYIEIKNGYHPLLRWRDKQTGQDNTVPMDIHLGRDFTTLIITGPNTGGKTVTLKTVGMLCLLAQTGMYIPAGDGSSLPIFTQIFADIGDEQSLEASLSTFSAHLANIRDALEQADETCLVLLDELGAGTDPDEGSALGQAIIEDFTANKVRTIVTTHHGRLKTLAVNNPSVENGSLDFDRENLRPTYRFRMGIPGLSYAIETARKLGIGDKVTNRAESLIDRSERRLAAIITELSDRLQEAEKELGEARKSRLSYESLSKIYAEKLNNLEKEKKQIKKDALERAEKVVQQARFDIDRLIDEAKQAPKKIEALREARHQAVAKANDIKDEIKKIEPPPSSQKAKGEIGEKVYLPSMNTTGEIIEKPDRDGRVRIRIGGVTLVTDVAGLYHTDDKSAAAVSKTGRHSPYGDSNISMQIDLRGLTFDEAEPQLDKYLDEVYLAGLESVSIIHGKGTGALRTKIQNHLKNHSRVKSFRLGNWDEGSYGVTIVELKRDD
ncbi:MAG: endonuclease MutS2 [candidate division Zixibacteria bacterium]|nr:endonuclease MutS2 [candidate division Zixibacteria bacterium]